MSQLESKTRHCPIQVLTADTKPCGYHTCTEPTQEQPPRRQSNPTGRHLDAALCELIIIRRHHRYAIILESSLSAPSSQSLGNPLELLLWRETLGGGRGRCVGIVLDGEETAMSAVISAKDP